ncbi:hypothetical protein AC578_7473 [Pseudocercospora eumusae]|uniref:Uncharacterized protein n=1 Tax=Pseudocercospora eumusae TaxID=321146 RepID=A0A139H1H2_9PEZI|nr:hypothetical protein AC578_7473 [Pseudocercospora eumusae]KXS96294.1 hypothetical protein AC578_7473 [Pseudocercospora eumusae]KXS96295.1 hypothetical protein AC578_7473 [Pseudocercospora eumusae]
MELWLELGMDCQSRWRTNEMTLAFASHYRVPSAFTIWSHIVLLAPTPCPHLTRIMITTNSGSDFFISESSLGALALLVIESRGHQLLPLDLREPPSAAPLAHPMHFRRPKSQSARWLLLTTKFDSPSSTR